MAFRALLCCLLLVPLAVHVKAKLMRAIMLYGLFSVSTPSYLIVVAVVADVPVGWCWWLVLVLMF